MKNIRFSRNYKTSLWKKNANFEYEFPETRLGELP